MAEPGPSRRLLGKVVCTRQSPEGPVTDEVELVEESGTVSRHSRSDDMSKVSSGSTASKKRKTKPCPIDSCDIRVQHLKRHVSKMHLPWYVAAHTAC